MNYKRASFWRVLVSVGICVVVVIGFMTNPKGQEFIAQGQEFVAEVEKEIQEELGEDVSYDTTISFAELEAEISAEMEAAKGGKYENLNILCEEVRFPDSGQIKELRFPIYEFTSNMSVEEKADFYKDIVYPKLLDLEEVKPEGVQAHYGMSASGTRLTGDYTYLVEHAEELDEDDIQLWWIYEDNENYYSTETMPEGICFNTNLGRLSSFFERNSPWVYGRCELVKTYNCYSDDLSDAYLLMDGTQKTVAEGKAEIEAYLDAHYPLVGGDNGIRNEVYEIQVKKVPGTEYYIFDAGRTFSYEGSRVKEHTGDELWNEVGIMAEAILCESNKVDITVGFVNCFEKGSIAKVYEEYSSFADVMENVSSYVAKNAKRDVLDIAVEYRIFSEEGEESCYRWVPYWSFLIENPTNDITVRVYVNIETGEIECISP